MTTTTTTNSRFLLAAMALAPAIVAFGYAWPVRAVLTQVEITSMFGLAASGLMLAIGAYNVPAGWTRWQWKKFVDRTEREYVRGPFMVERSILPKTGSAVKSFPTPTHIVLETHLGTRRLSGCEQRHPTPSCPAT